jgi:hypothetical protein
MSKIGNDLRKLEAWFAKVFTTVENDAEKAAVFIVAKLDPEIEKLIADGTIIVVEKVVDAVTNSSIGDTIGTAIIKDWPEIVRVAQDVQKVIGGLPMIKTLIAAQIAGILNTFKTSPSEPRLQIFISGVETAYQDLVADVKQIID